jgi:ferredoxin
MPTRDAPPSHQGSRQSNRGESCTEPALISPACETLISTPPSATVHIACHKCRKCHAVCSVSLTRCADSFRANNPWSSPRIPVLIQMLRDCTVSLGYATHLAIKSTSRIDATLPCSKRPPSTFSGVHTNERHLAQPTRHLFHFLSGYQTVRRTTTTGKPTLMVGPFLHTVPAVATHQRPCQQHDLLHMAGPSIRSASRG